MSHSIAQQLALGAKIGAALQQAGVTQEQLRKILGSDMRARARLHQGWLAEAGRRVPDRQH